MLGSCINWTKSKDKQGYRCFKKNGKWVKAHRYFYEQKFGKIPEKLVIDHLCKNSSCINPDHMEAVTNAENVRRGNSAKLNFSLIEKIKIMYKSMKFSQIELANIFGVGQPNISRIINQERWI